MSKGISRCKSCGAQIIWIRTKAGKNMPVNPHIINFRRPEAGEDWEDMLVKEDGDVVPGIRIEPYSGGKIGYISHFATCQSAGRHRKD